MLPTNVIAPHLQHLTKRLRRPVARELTAYTRGDVSPVARSLLQTFGGVHLAPRPPDAYLAS